MPVKIHGKDYLTVAERVTMIKKETKGNYSIMTELLKFEGGSIVMRATLKIDSNVYTGTAMEEIGSSQINTTSALENCESSAIGRSAAAGGWIGDSNQFCSADELTNALKQQASKPVDKKPVTKSKPTTVKVGEVYGGVKVVEDEEFAKELITVEAIKEKFGEDGVEVEDDLVKYLVTFGKHQGKEWKDVEESYVVWCANNSKVDWQREEAKLELQRRNNKPKRQVGGVSDVAYEMQNKDSGDEGVNLKTEMPS